MKITICVGSSCHLKGSRQVVEELEKLIEEKGLKDQIIIEGIFCLGLCEKTGVNVKIDEERFSVTPETVDTFFNNEVLPRLKA